MKTGTTSRGKEVVDKGCQGPNESKKSDKEKLGLWKYG